LQEFLIPGKIKKPPNLSAQGEVVELPGFYGKDAEGRGI
jgi:hypothetical protein